MLVLSSRLEDEEKEASKLSCNSCNGAEKIKVQQYAVLNNNRNNMQFSLVKSR